MAETVAIIGAVISAASYVEARSEAKDSRRAQENIRQEQVAQNASDAARERRQQIREERVRRARLMQAASNTGSAGSSGEMGAMGGLSTNLASNIGANIGRLQSANNISLFAQEDANSRGNIADAQAMGQWGQTMFQLAPVAGAAADSLFSSGKWNGVDFSGKK